MDAMESHQTLTIRYDGEDRLIEPHTLGVTKAGSLALRAYEVSPSDNFRLYKVEKIDSFVFPLRQASEAPRHGFVRGDSAMIHIFKELDSLEVKD